MSRETPIDVTPSAGTAAERKVLSLVPTSSVSLYERMTSKGDVVIDAHRVSNSCPDVSTKGLKITGVLLGVRFDKLADGKSSGRFVMIITGKSVGSAVVDASPPAERMLVPYGTDGRVLHARVNVAYPLTPADKEVLKAAGIVLHTSRKNGFVSVGVTPLYLGAVISISRYDTEAKDFVDAEGMPITPGARLMMLGVDIKTDFANGELSDNVFFNGSRFTVLKNDNDNSRRLGAAMSAANAVPPLYKDDTKYYGVWNPAMHLCNDISATTRAALAAAAGSAAQPLPTSSTPCITDGSAESAAATTAGLLVCPPRPRIFNRTRASFVLHLGASQPEQMVRIAATTGGLPTVCNMPFASTSKEAFSYVDMDKREQTRAMIIVTGTQISLSNTCEEFVLHLTLPPAGVQHLTAFINPLGQRAILPFLVPALTGPIVVDVNACAEAEISEPALAGASIFRGYVNFMPPVVAQKTIATAGLEVSPRFAQIERAVAMRPNSHEDAVKAASNCEYYKTDGIPSERSALLALAATSMGFFDAESQAKVLAVSSSPAFSLKPIPDQRALIAPLVDAGLTGPLVSLAKTHVFFVVGRLIPTSAVIEHQRELRAKDRSALMKGNEHLLLTGTVPPSFPVEVYQAALDATAAAAPSASSGKAWCHYAVLRSETDDETAYVRLVEQLDSIKPKSTLSDGNGTMLLDAAGMKREGVFATSDSKRRALADDHEEVD